MASHTQATHGDTRRPGTNLVVGATVTLAGLSQLLLSYACSGWISSVLVNTGTASLLFAPLYLVQRKMEIRVRETKRSLDGLSREVRASQTELRQSMEELQRAFTARNTQLSEERERDVASIVEQPSCQVVYRTLTAAIEERVISQRGLRVHVVDPDVFVFSRLIPTTADTVRIILEKRDGQPIAQVDWTADQTPATLMTEISDRLRAASLSSDSSFDPTLLFRELHETLRVARDVKDRYALIDDMARAQEYVPPQWIIYDWGIGAWHEGVQPYYIDRSRLHDQDLTRHMSEKIWLHRTSFDEALATALLLEKRGRPATMTSNS